MNIKPILVALIIVVALITGCTTAPIMPPASPVFAPLSYGKTYTLQNYSAKVVVAPEIGRIIHFGFAGDRNLIWLKDRGELAKEKVAGAEWLNWGGDKVWPAQQADWSFIYGGGDWPPKTDLDGMPFKIIESSGQKLVMESVVDKKMHVKLRRTLMLDREKPKLTIENRLIQESPSPWPVHIWSVTQCVSPNYTLLGVDKEAPDYGIRPFSNLWDAPLPESNAKLMNGSLRFSLEENLSIAKTGTIGNWCAAVYDDVIFLQESDAPPNGCYPDGANIEVFLCERYTELEILSPSKHLQKGENISSIATWSLIKTKPSVTAEDTLKLIKK